MFRYLLLTITTLLVAITSLSAQENIDTANTSGIEYSYTPIVQSDSTHSGHYILNPETTGKRGNISLLLIPIYTPETNLGIGVGANYQLRSKDGHEEDLVWQLSLLCNASITGFYNIRISGNNWLGSSHRNQIDYGLNIESEPSRIWGIDYNAACGNKYHKYTQKEYSLWGRYTHFIKAFRLGLYGDYRHLGIANPDTEATTILQNEPQKISTAGIGWSITYDSRKLSNNTPLKGIYATVETIYRPKSLNNLNGNLWNISATIDYYQPLWKSAILAFDIHGELHSSNTPWLLSAELSSVHRMRSYYIGRYRGNRLATMQVELRQYNIWHGLGAAAWLGGGIALSSHETFDWNYILPTYGIGLRYNLYDTLFRLDAGFGRDGVTFILGINEAF